MKDAALFIFVIVIGYVIGTSVETIVKYIWPLVKAAIHGAAA